MICETCPVAVRKGQSGRWPRFCGDCGKARRREANNAAQRRYRERHAADLNPREAERAKRSYAQSPERRQYLWAYNLKRLYGITGEQYEAMVREQNGVCAICEGPPVGRAIRLHVDHCHDTGRVRGLLCGKCNTAIAFLGDNPDLLKRVSDYFAEE